MLTLREASLVPAWLPRTATFLEAARALADAALPALAILDDERRVVGLFAADDLVAGLFPPYLRELRHTAFARNDEALVAERADEVSREPVERHMSPPVTVELDSSALHAAERFLHVACEALAVVDRGRFAGMLTEIAFARWILDHLGVVGRRS